MAAKHKTKDQSAYCISEATHVDVLENTASGTVVGNGEPW